MKKRSKSPDSDNLPDQLFELDTQSKNNELVLSFKYLVAGERGKIDRKTTPEVLKSYGTIAIDLSKKKLQSQIQNGRKVKPIRLYGEYPTDHGPAFPKPSDTPQDAKWGRVRVSSRIRYIGHLVNHDSVRMSVFYVYYIDPHHEFCPRERD